MTTFFSTYKYGLLLQDTISIEEHIDSLIGVDIPHLFLVSGSKDDGKDAKLVQQTLSNFEGLREINVTSKKAILSFSLNLTVGNVDEAYKAVQGITEPGVWAKMAAMCVRTKRLDVAEICLGKMGHARGAIAVRDYKQRVTEPEAQIAMVAIQLGFFSFLSEPYHPHHTTHVHQKTTPKHHTTPHPTFTKTPHHTFTTPPYTFTKTSHHTFTKNNRKSRGCRNAVHGMWQI